MDRREALVLSPGSVNYFYDVTGRRLAEALADLGYSVTVSTLAAFSTDSKLKKRHFSVGVLVNVPEIAFSIGDPGEASLAFGLVRKRSRQLFAIGMDCVSTPWFSNLFRQSLEVGVDSVIDLGFVNQGDAVSDCERQHYHFMVAGLTRAEREQLQSIDLAPENRPIPWVFVGHHTPRRQALADRLAAELDPEGFVYLPPLEPYRATGPHLNEEELTQLLERARLQIWCSHHDSFYMESERLRMSLLAGALPVKVVSHRHEIPQVPFRANLFEEDSLISSLRQLADRSAFELFRNEYLQLPSLADELARLLVQQTRSRRSILGTGLRQIGRRLLFIRERRKQVLATEVQR